MAKQTLDSALIKTQNIIKTSSDTKLSSILPNLKSSHDAAFVFRGEKFLGVINPFYTIVKTQSEPTTKAENALYHPPRISVTDTPDHVARMMMDSKIHYLPVFDETDTFVGITTARRLLRLMLKTATDSVGIQALIEEKDRPMVSVYPYDTLLDALELFQQHQVSKLVVINKNMKLIGVLSYFDLIPYFSAETDRHTRKKRSHDKEQLKNMKVKDYAKKTVITLNQSAPLKKAITEILDREIGSVIIIDKQDRPLNIITTKDILQLIVPENATKPIKLVTKGTSEQTEEMVEDLSAYLQKHIERSSGIQGAEIIVQEEQERNLFELNVYLIPEKGSMEVIKREGKDFKTLLKDVKEVIKKSKSSSTFRRSKSKKQNQH